MNLPWRWIAARLGIVALLAVAGCALRPGSAGAPRIIRTADSVPSLFEAKRQVSKYVASGRYEGEIAQMIDLDGAAAERAYKLPNPFYFLR